jgi:hypothetical protein
MFKHKKVQFIKCSNLKIFKIVRKKIKEKNKKRNKKPEKPGNQKKRKSTTKKEKTSSAALTGRPSVAPTRAEPSFAPLTGGA